MNGFLSGLSSGTLYAFPFAVILEEVLTAWPWRIPLLEH